MTIEVGTRVTSKRQWVGTVIKPYHDDQVSAGHHLVEWEGGRRNVEADDDLEPCDPDPRPKLVRADSIRPGNYFLRAGEPMLMCHEGYCIEANSLAGVHRPIAVNEMVLPLAHEMTLDPESLMVLTKLGLK